MISNIILFSSGLYKKNSQENISYYALESVNVFMLYKYKKSCWK